VLAIACVGISLSLDGTGRQDAANAAAISPPASLTLAVPLSSQIPASGTKLEQVSSSSSDQGTEAYLYPAAPSGSEISASQASSDALAIDNGPTLQVTQTVLASVTLPSTIPTPSDTAPSGETDQPIIRQEMWIIVVTSPTPTLIPMGCVGALGSGTTATSTSQPNCPEQSYTEDVMFLSAISGKFEAGYFSNVPTS